MFDLIQELKTYLLASKTFFVDGSFQTFSKGNQMKEISFEDACNELHLKALKVLRLLFWDILRLFDAMRITHQNIFWLILRIR